MPRESCPICRRSTSTHAFVLPSRGDAAVWKLVADNHPHHALDRGVCPSCYDTYRGFWERLQHGRWAVGRDGPWVLPLHWRLKVDDRYTGRGVTIAFLDSGFHLHPDLVEPENRVIAYVNILHRENDEQALWREVSEPNEDAWHGLMTSVIAAGNGFLSGGIYRSLAPQANLVLVKVGSIHRIRHDDIRRGIEWVVSHREQYGIRVLNISCGGDYAASYLTDGLSQVAEEAVRRGIVVVAAVGNKGRERGHPVLPPASAPAVITVGGLNDGNQLDWRGYRLYHSSYGPTVDGLQKPEVIAPSIWLPAPILPGTSVAQRAALFDQLDRAPDDRFKAILNAHRGIEPRLDALIDRPVFELRDRVRRLKRRQRVISAHYQHVDGTSFAAPIVSSVVAQMLEANPDLTPQQVKLALIETARRLPRVNVDRQGWGVINPRAAIARAQRTRQSAMHMLASPAGSLGERDPRGRNRRASKEKERRDDDG